MGKEFDETNSKKEWREFEKLVARIERHIAGTDLKIRSPDHIKDLVTGTPREVDASIRSIIGSAPILITIECRDRKGNEDVTWIEQLANKKVNIGADKTIAVSSSGFSKEAIAKANNVGIELRHLEEITDNDLVDILRIGRLKVYQSVIHVFATRVNFDLGADETVDITIAENPSEDFQQNNLDAKILYVTNSKELISLRQLLNNSLEGFVTLESGRVIIPPNDQVTFGADPLNAFCFRLLEDSFEGDYKFCLEFSKSKFNVETVSGIFGVIKIEIELHIVLSKKRLENQYYQYSNLDGKYSKSLGEATGTVDGDEVIISWSPTEDGDGDE